MAFAVGFGLFVLAMIVIAAFAVRWGVGQDRRRRATVQDAPGATTGEGRDDEAAEDADGGDRRPGGPAPAADQ